ASSSPACEERSASSPSIPDLAQKRSCHEQGRPTRGYVIIRDGTDTLYKLILVAIFAFLSLIGFMPGLRGHSLSMAAQYPATL
ncbi:hypothetical protein JMK10_19525, partial [Rhodovulum sulfidophilum]|uniref:hypothetical protein n=1 Tax=Rhodovulum sulfidophilum TaxID=35806 RepID=UPI001F436785